jgi:hypothetical protein
MHQSPAAIKAMSSQATQTSPSIPANVSVPNVVAQAKQGMATSQHAPNGQKPAQAQAAPPKKTRRRTGKEYLIAARQRRQEQEDWNYHHPPTKDEDIYICEFCEYELIFGTPPEALIKQYEIKDRRLRKKEAEKRRLLEKAKMRARKGKKGNKNAPKTSSVPQNRQPQQQQAQQPTSANQSQSQGTQSEEYYEDEYDDEYPQDEPPPSPVAPPAARRSEVTHPDPGKQTMIHGAASIDTRITA